MRYLLRLLFASAVAAALLLAILYAPDGSSLSTWDREPHVVLLALWAVVACAGLVLAASMLLHRVTDLLEALGLPASHAREIAEAEARGEAPA